MQLFVKFVFGIAIFLSASLVSAQYNDPLDVINVTALRQNPTYQGGNITGKGVAVIVIDAEFDINHPDYKNKLTSSIHIVTKQKLGPDDIGNHGTHIAGIIAGSKFGVAPDVKLSFIKVPPPRFDEFSYLKQYDCNITNALEYAAKSTGDIVSMSIKLSARKDAAITDNIREALVKVAQSGKSLYFASGNIGVDLGSTTYTKSLVEISESSGMKGAMVLVGNLDAPKLELHPSSNLSGLSKRFLVAPGTKTFSSLSKPHPDIIQCGHGQLTGTSMATAMVTGGAAILKGTFPGLTPLELNEILFKSAKKDLHKNEFGHGIIDVQAAFQMAWEKQPKKN